MNTDKQRGGYLVSVIIPTYNPKYLRETIDSVFNQSYPHWELIIVDDGSTTDLSWIEIYDTKVKFIKQRKAGAAVARNLGVLLSKGDFIAFLDHDDIWRPKKLERQIDTFKKNPEIGMCHCELEIVRGNIKFNQKVEEIDEEPTITLKPIEPSNTLANTNLYESIRYFSSKLVVPATTLIRKEILANTGLLNPHQPYTCDYSLIIKIGSMYPVAIIPNKDALYRIHDHNFSKDYHTARRETKEIISELKDFARRIGDKKAFNNAKPLIKVSRSNYAAKAYDQCRIAIRSKKRLVASKHLAYACFFSPVFVAKSLIQFAKDNTTLKSNK